MLPPDYPDAPRSGVVEDGKKFERLLVELLRRFLKTDLEIFEDRHSQYTIGESPQGYEAKLDATSLHSGLQSCECFEKRRRDGVWVASGILREDNTHTYCIGNWKWIHCVPKSRLVAYFLQYCHDTNFLQEFNGTIKRFFLPVQFVRQMSTFWFECVDGEWKLRLRYGAIRHEHVPEKADPPPGSPPGEWAYCLICKNWIRPCQPECRPGRHVCHVL